MCNGKGFILCYGSDCLMEGNYSESRSCPACHGEGALDAWRQSPLGPAELWTWSSSLDPLARGTSDREATITGFHEGYLG
jgi:hypothetical protein